MLEIEGLHVSYFSRSGSEVRAVRGIDIEVPEGAVFTLLGPSGCGKSTTLRSVAGLETPTSGVIRSTPGVLYDSESGTVVPSHKRQIGMVFQSYAIWPHMTVFQNVAFPLQYGAEDHRKAEVHKLVHRALELVELEAFSDRPGSALSGGQQQRVALARSIVGDPSLLLLDEPMSNLDAKLRERMRLEVRSLQQRLGITTLYVTHDQTEAMAISDYIGVMKDGVLVQVGKPREIYERPTSRFVADFIGSTNFLKGEPVSARAGEFTQVEVVGLGPLSCLVMEDLDPPGGVGICIRPENLRLLDIDDPRPEFDNVFDGKVREVLDLGEVVEELIEIGTQLVRVKSDSARQAQVGAPVKLGFRASDTLGLRDE